MELMSKRLLAVVLLIWLLPVLITAQTSSASTRLTTLSARGAAAIDQMFQTAIDKRAIPGVVVAITNRKQVLYLKALANRTFPKMSPCPKTPYFG